MRPRVAARIRVEVPASEEDQSGWLVTFSDLVLQLFAFVLVATVLGGRPRPVASLPAVEQILAAAPAVAAPVASPAPVDQRAEAPLPAAAIGEPPPARESVEEVARALAPVTPPAVVVEAPPAAAPSLPAGLVRAGEMLQRFVVASGHEDTVAVRVNPRDVVLSLNDAIGFPSGSADLGGEAGAILREIVGVVESLPDVRIDVVGHTDDQPIRTPKFPSNLELSLARAARVARELTALAPALTPRTFAAGAGAEQPAVANDSPAGRARNRRVDVHLVPPGRPPTVG